MYAALQILMPGSEFADRAGWGEPAADVRWIEPVPKEEVAFLLFLYAPGPEEEPSLFHAPKGLEPLRPRSSSQRAAAPRVAA
jgi:hypothetical protein